MLNLFQFGRLRKSIFAKFAFSFIIVGLIPLLVLSFFSLNTYGNYMERYSINNFEQMVLYAGKNADDLYTKYNNISKMMYSYGQYANNGQFGRVIAEQVSQKDNRLTATVDEFLQTVVASDVHIRSAAFVFTEGGYQDLNRDGSRIDFRFQYPPVEWKRTMTENSKELVLFPTHPQEYYPHSGMTVMTFSRNLIDVIGSPGLDGKVVGSLFFDVSLSAFDEIFQHLTTDQKDVMYVTDQEGRILYSNKINLIGQLFQPSDSEVYHYVKHDMPNSNWSVIGEVNKNELFNKINGIKRTIAIVIGLCILSLVVVAVWFSNNLSIPIRQIIRNMTRVESGDFNMQVQVRTSDEIGMLARGFNRMTDRLKSFIDEVYVAQIKQKQAELTALKSQIRPHYLYNTLEVIRMSAVANDDDEVADMILSLSQQLKYVLNYGEEHVTLLEEKTNIEQYFRLMKLRYGDHRLALDLRIDSELLNCILPKLSIQPLVENAIYHGIMPKSGKGTIRITGEIERGLFMLTVDDDGVGMTEGKLQMLRDKLAGNVSPDQEVGGIGIKNVHDRITALYGPEFGIRVNSTPYIGTSIQMILPYKKEVKSV
ncbi:sensor histidine kinase [Paenibacillus sp. GCM10023248]|uniref:cache domain-containing sensor histidine kinase n=1 Tax=unclassified Paenibacillus TaxID=185978 RepID=UPI002378B168|nr:sensor histidine kinase [Paenibacillus sp. MAHUQ-63]MDD9265428.1 sensor histidine kinase [Paenibacillus sp. MAHUQ-63]